MAERRTFAPKPEVFRSENEAWRKVLGKDVEITPLPSMITPEVIRQLERLGLEFRFIPKVDIGTVDVLQKKGVEKYLDELQARYPGWRRYESLSYTDRRDHLIGRNLNEFYWKHTKDGDIDFPRLPAVWLAVETMPKPSYGDSYKMTAIADKLGLTDRFNVSWNDAQDVIQEAKREIIYETGLLDVNIRMLEAVELNLLANREGWGATNTYEWTNTEYREDGRYSCRVMAGSSDDGGAANVSWASPNNPNDGVGFRLAVALG